MKKYIQLPKGYLSYSQLELWKRSPKSYADKYFDGRDELFGSNHAMDYGKVVADALEHGVQTGDLMTDSAMLMLPKYDVADQEFRVDMTTRGGYVTLLVKPDSFNSETKSFYEYKTGKTPWTQDKAQRHLQMWFYATAIFCKYGCVPKDCKLIWIETAVDGGSVTPTGLVREFPVVFTIKEILSFMVFVARIAREIEVAWAAHVPNKAILEW